MIRPTTDLSDPHIKTTHDKILQGTFTSLIYQEVGVPTKSKYQKQKEKKHTYQNQYKGFTINTNTNKGHGCNMDILDRIIQRLIYMIAEHDKVKPLRADLHFPKGFEFEVSKNYISIFVKYLKEKLDNMVINTHHPDPQIYWVMEKDKSSLPHYHLLVLVNGNAICDNIVLVSLIESVWKSVLKEDYKDGLVHHCRKVYAQSVQINIPIDSNFQLVQYSGHIGMIRFDYGIYLGRSM